MNGPLVVQSDFTILLETDHPEAEQARELLSAFAELVKSPEHVHTYRLSGLSLWNAASSGLTADAVLRDLAALSRYPLPDLVRQFVAEQMGRYGRLRLVSRDGRLLLEADDPALVTQLLHRGNIRPHLGERVGPAVTVNPDSRGVLKQLLTRAGWPLADEAGYAPGVPFDIRWVPRGRLDGEPFSLRAYQEAAVQAFYGDGRAQAGSGVIVLPCGAGKTLVGLGVMTKVRAHTLILTTSVAAAHQWRRELLNRTSVAPEDVGEYTATSKQVRPITLATYQILSHRVKGRYAHFQVMDEGDWGLVIYDEVHLLPAPIFRLTAAIQARRRLGLTATLIREDGREDDVFALIGPKRFDMPWRDLEAEGWIAPARCHEIRVDLPDTWQERYAVAEDSDRARLAAENPAKLRIIDELLEHHREDRVLIIGQYLQQLEQVAEHVDAPLITGKLPNARREELYEAFRTGTLTRLVVSKVANFAIDLPEANVAIQISGTFGSRQEEAQRLGRVLRPKRDGGPAYFYTVVSDDTVEQLYAQKRQLFLTEQGYRYQIARVDAAGADRAAPVPAPVIAFPREAAASGDKEPEA
jgi:DNA excision repair protein ERCC-3